MTQKENRAMMFGMVERWQESGMSQAAYAQSQNISLIKFRYWILKYHQSHEQGAFVQLSGFCSSSGISIRYPNGVELALPAQTPVAVVKSLINL
jgi:hypothetical protein